MPQSGHQFDKFLRALYNGSTQARRAGGSAKISACLSAEQYLADKAVFLPVTYSSQYFAGAPGVSGFIFHPYGGGVDFTNARK